LESSFYKLVFESKIQTHLVDLTIKTTSLI